MKIVKTPMTFEQYEAKYPNYQSKLLSFSDAEIKEFNEKFYKSNGNKNIPNKYALLEKYKWVHIKDRYYQVPRVSKLGKAGICVLAAGVIAAGVAVPIKLLSGNNGLVLTEEEFKVNLSYVYKHSENRKYKATYTTQDSDPKNGGDDSKSGIIQVSGTDIKHSIISSKSTTEHYMKYYHNKAFIKDAGSKLDNALPNSWVRLTDPDDDFVYQKYGYTLELYSNNFDKFTKSGNVYSCSEIVVVPDANGKEGEKAYTADLTFNEDKTLKKMHQICVSQDPKNGGEEKFTTDVEFSEMGTHSFDDLKDITPFQKLTLNLNYDKDGYKGTAKNLTNNIIDTIIEVVVRSDSEDNPVSFQYIYLESNDKINGYYPLEDKEIKSIKDNSGNEIKDQCTISGNVIALPGKVSTLENKVTITFGFNNDNDENWNFIASNTSPSF